MRQARRHGHGLIVLYVDVDDLRRVNDTFGHEQGDEVLRLVAAALRAATRDSDVVARAGGDEFVALVEATEDAGPALIRRLRRRLSAPVHGRVRVPRTTVSVGCVYWAADQPAGLQDLMDAALTDLGTRAVRS